MNLIKLSDVYLKEHNNHKVAYVSITDDLKLYVGYEKINTIEIEDVIVQKNNNIPITATVYGEAGQKLEGVPLTFSIDDDTVDYIIFTVSDSIIQANDDVVISAKAYDKNNQPVPNIYIKFLDVTEDEELDNDYINKLYVIDFDDDNDVSKLRPQSVTVRLYAGGEEVETYIASEETNWIASFSNLPRTVGGYDIKYSITVDPVEHYVEEITDSIIALTLLVDEVTETIMVSWQDDNAQSRPSNITFTSNGQSITVLQSNDYIASKSLPQYINGEEIAYDWLPPEIPSYKLLSKTKNDYVTSFIFKYFDDSLIPPIN